MPSKIAIWNRACGLIGTQTQIATENEDSTEAHNCGIYYDPVRQAILRAHTWNFARRQETLTELGNADDGTSLTPWFYKYAYPSTCLRFRYVMPVISASTSIPESLWTAQPPIRFIMSSDTDSGGNPRNVLLTNQNAALGVWTWDVELLDLWDALALDALAHGLAAKLAIPLTGDKALAKAKIDEASSIIQTAKAMDGNEGLRIQEHVPDWIRVRGYASDYAQWPPYLASDPVFLIN